MNHDPTLDGFETFRVMTYDNERTTPESVHLVTTDMTHAIRAYVRLVAHELKPYIVSNLQPGSEWRSFTGWRTAAELADAYKH